MIGILFESNEWSNIAIKNHIISMGEHAKLIDMQADNVESELNGCDIVINRVFPNAIFRAHQKSLERMPVVNAFLENKGVPMINSYKAHLYETNKELTYNTLRERGFPVPKVYGVFTPAQIVETTEIEYPCVIEPNCSRRTHYTFLVNSKEELVECVKNVPDVEFIAEKHMYPEYGYITGIIVVNGSCQAVLKRSVTPNDISAFHLGVTYTRYENCSEDIRNTALKAMELLQIDIGGIEIIENKDGFHIVDVNSVPNVSENNASMFGFDLVMSIGFNAVRACKKKRGFIF